MKLNQNGSNFSGTIKEQVKIHHLTVTILNQDSTAIHYIDATSTAYTES